MAKKIKKTLLFILILSLLLIGSPLSGFCQQEVAVPDRLGVDSNGKEFFLKDNVGKDNLYLVFWATWCPSCIQAIPSLVDTYKNIKDVKLVAINPGFNDSIKNTRKYVDRYQIPYLTLHDETGLSAQAFGVYGIPTAVLINKKGEVVYMGFPLPADRIPELLD